MVTGTEEADVVVIGAGFGGLGAAMGLAGRGATVVVCELLDYPGGCAGTFERKGARFDAGATLSSGLGEGQLFREWLSARRVSLEIQPLDPVVELRMAGGTLEVCADRAKFVDRVAALAGSRADDVRRFFALQRAIADGLWQVLDDPAALPPFGAGGLMGHVRRLGPYTRVARWVGRTLLDVLAHFDLADVPPLRTFCDAVCQITVQCPASEAEAPFALATLDYFFRGVAHVRGGIGELARALVLGLRGEGVRVDYHRPVRSLTRVQDRWRVETRRGHLLARSVVANVLPQALAKMMGEEVPRLTRLSQALEQGWGAAMLYLVAREPEGAPRGAHHLELVADDGAALIEGNHVFVSVSGADEGRAPQGMRALTVSTHLPASKLRAMDEAERGAYVGDVQRKMRALLDERAPEWGRGVERAMTASPRTFERYTRRPLGLVGGVPRRAGLHNYADAFPRPVAPGLWLVGDSVFPGQSTLAAALGGLAASRALAATVGLPPLE